MQINSIAPKITNTSFKGGLSRLGQSVQKKDSFASKLNNFAEGRGMNIGRAAFLALIASCTLIPRFLKARDDDERSEIIRRDVTTILTISFAMKALKAGACQLMAKKSGIPLTFTNIPENANKFKKALGYFQQKGTTAFSAEDITANYANIDNKDALSRMLEFVDKNNGKVGKFATFDKAKAGKNKPDGPLYTAFKKLLGDDFDFSKPNQEIINAINAKDANNAAFIDIAEVLKDTKTNPISKFAKGIGAIFETASLAAVTGFLGFGLPKLNEKITKDKYFDKNGGNLPRYENPDSGVPLREMPISKTLSSSQMMLFQSFMGTSSHLKQQQKGLSDTGFNKNA